MSDDHFDCRCYPGKDDFPIRSEIVVPYFCYFFEGLAEGSLTIVLIHIAIVSFAPLWKKLAKSRSGSVSSPFTRQA